MLFPVKCSQNTWNAFTVRRNLILIKTYESLRRKIKLCNNLIFFFLGYSDSSICQFRNICTFIIKLKWWSILPHSSLRHNYWNYISNSSVRHNITKKFSDGNKYRKLLLLSNSLEFNRENLCKFMAQIFLFLKQIMSFVL